MQLLPGVEHRVGNFLAQLQLSRVHRAHAVHVHHRHGRHAHDVQRRCPQVFAVFKEPQVKYHLVLVGDGFAVHVEAVDILDHQRGADAVAHHGGHILGARLGELYVVGQPVVEGDAAVAIQNMQVGTDPGHHQAVGHGKAGIGAQHIFPQLGAVGTQTKDGAAVIVQQPVAKGRHLLGDHGA